MQHETKRFKDLLTLTKEENIKAQKDFEISRDSLRQPYRSYCFSLLYCTLGGVVIENDRRTFELNAGSDFCFLPHTVSTLVSMTPNARFSFVAISEVSHLEKCGRMGPSFLRFLYRNPLSPKRPDAIYYRKNFYEQMDYYCQQTKGKYLYEKRMNLVQNYFFDIYDHTEELLQKEDEGKDALTSRVPLKFVNLLLENCIEHHDVEFYANELGITPRYMSTLLSKFFGGHTPKELIDDHLIFEAKNLLRDPQLTVQEVAERLNFSDQSVFARLFRRKTNLSPSEWRKTEV